MPLRLTRLNMNDQFTADGKGPGSGFQRTYNKALASIEDAYTDLAEQLAAIAAAQAAAAAANAAAAAANTAAATAQTAADTAQNAADDVTEASSLATSFVDNFTPPVVEADNAGNVTIANHDRVYGDGTSVAVTGDTVATGEVNPAIVYIYYSDPARAGGAVTYQFSTTESDAAQIGDIHNVGAVTIPAAGTQSGGYARPPGYGGVIP